MASNLIDPRLVTGNKGKIVNENVPTDLDTSRRALGLVESAGHSLCPPGSTYIGSATIHFYKTGEAGLSRDFHVIEQLQLSNVEEGLADLGHKQLRDAMMRNYGRTPPRQRS